MLVTDVIMPQLPGKEAAERIDCPLSGGEGLVHAGYWHGVLDSQSVLAADVHLIEKPFTEKALLAKLREAISAGS